MSPGLGFRSFRCDSCCASVYKRSLKHLLNVHLHLVFSSPPHVLINPVWEALSWVSISKSLKAFVLQIDTQLPVTLD